ncbi:MAG: YkgJ family cysteine cluster protein [Bacteroidota bacterium]
MSELPAHWIRLAESRHKVYRQFLERVNRNKALALLPDLHEAASEATDCLQCAQCCKSFSPRFKTPDIKRISRVMGLRESEFIERYLKVDDEGDYVTRTTPCPLLGADNHCSIYADRPSDCRRFPYTDEDVLIKRSRITLENVRFCPITYRVVEGLMEKLKDS